MSNGLTQYQIDSLNAPVTANGQVGTRGECDHGQLASSCERCDEREIASLSAELERVNGERQRADAYADTLIQKLALTERTDALRSELERVKKQRDAAIRGLRGQISIRKALALSGVP